MKKSKFQQLLADGYGSAIVFLKSTASPMDYARQIEYCCTHDTCFDMQSEGDRADYLFGAIRLTGQENYFLERIMHRLERKHNLTDWECTQMLRIIVLYRRNGFPEAERFLDSLYERSLDRLLTGKHTEKRSDEFEELCIFLSDEDVSYFVRTVSRIGKYLTEYPLSDVFSLDYFYMRFLDINGKAYSRKLLENVPKEYVKAFDKAFYCSDFYWLSRSSRKKNAKRPSPSFERLTECLNGNENIEKKRMLTKLFAIFSDESELKRLAELMLSEKDEKKKLIMLDAFDVKPFPLDSGILFHMFDSGSKEVREALFYAMCHITDNDERVKKYASEELSGACEDPELAAAALNAYISKSRKNDAAYLLSVLKNGNFDKYSLHQLFGEIQKAYDRFPTRKARDILMYIYEHQSCTVCRYDLIRTMSKCRCLTDEILNEAVSDANPDTRVYAEKRLRK